MRLAIVAVALALLLLCLPACSQPTASTCQRITDRAAVAKTFCVSLVRQVAEQQCAELDGKPDHEKCLEVIGMAAAPDCLGRTGFAQIEWARTEFCE